ncbi:MAG: Glycosyl hydrolases family 31 [candidate division BRC1 bacterium ADurb.BinA364]|nr:MAG: Glycosyl hydrolases family 31 [candidate division BRC1 bacterium ADurb.BinA364]
MAKPNPALWPDPAGALARLRENGVEAVFETPSLFFSREWLREAPLEARLALPSAEPARVPTALDFPFDYAAAGAERRFAERFDPLRAAGMANWLCLEDIAPAAAASGAARALERAAFWRGWMRKAAGGRDAEGFVLDPRSTAELAALAHWPAPWAVDPAAESPADAFLAAGRAEQAGLPFWGLELPIAPSAYSSPEQYRQWLQCALCAPLALLRAQNWREAFSSETDFAALEALRHFGALRRRLAPYYESLARRSAESGAPFAWLAAESALGDSAPAAWLGPGLLFVAPRAGDGAFLRVVFPRGEWFSLADNRRFQGGAAIELPRPAERFEAFACRGALIPFVSAIEGRGGQTLACRLYPSAQGEFALRIAQENGEESRTDWRWEWQGIRHTMSIEIESAGDAAERDCLLQVYAKSAPRMVSLNGERLARGKFVLGDSRLFDAGAPLALDGAALPDETALWDHDGANWMYFWLPKRSAATRIEILAQPSLAPSAAPEL